MESDRFEEDIIYSLDLSSKSMVGIGDVSKCVNLVILNMSKNNLKSLEGMVGLEKLMTINISFNMIRDLSPLSSCASLMRIDALSNDVSDIECVNVLYLVGGLRVLNLQNVKKEETNPVCRHEGYRFSVTKAIPHLKRLDFIPVGFDIEKPNIGEAEDIDVSGFKISRDELYGDFSELEKKIADGKKVDGKVEILVQSMKDQQEVCKKKQEKSDDLLKEINKMLSQA